MNFLQAAAPTVEATALVQEVPQISDALRVMLFGMMGIFIVMGIIILCTTAMGRLGRKGKK